MGVRTQSSVDCDRVDQMGESILRIKEEIAHKRAYKSESDADLRQIELDSLIEQQRRQHG